MIIHNIYIYIYGLSLSSLSLFPIFLSFYFLLQATTLHEKIIRKYRTAILAAHILFLDIFVFFQLYIPYFKKKEVRGFLSQQLKKKLHLYLLFIQYIYLKNSKLVLALNGFFTCNNDYLACNCPRRKPKSNEIFSSIITK